MTQQVTSIQGTLALDFSGEDPPSPISMPEIPTGQPDLDEFAQRFSLILIEVMAGNRNPQSLMRWSSNDVYRQLSVRCTTLNRVARGHHRRQRSPVSLHRLHISHPWPSVAEVTIVARHGQRFRAIAARIQFNGRRWSCTELQFG